MTNCEDSSQHEPGADYRQFNDADGFSITESKSNDPSRASFDAGDLARIHGVVEQNQAFRGAHYLGSEVTRLVVGASRKFYRNAIDRAIRHFEASPAPAIPPLRIDGHFGVESIDPLQSTLQNDKD